ALGAVHADGTPVGARGHLAVFAFYPNKQMTTGEGGLVVCPSPELKERIDSERNQGRAPDMSWLDHDRLGFNYRLSDLACALGIAQLERLDELLAGRDRAAVLYGEAIAGIEGVELPFPDTGGNRRSWFVYVVKLPAEVDRDATIEALRARGIDSKPYLPAIHLMSFYRERFGHREGEFPVCEDVARRSLALPFFPQITEEQVAQVAESLGGGQRVDVGRSAERGGGMAGTVPGPWPDGPSAPRRAAAQRQEQDSASARGALLRPEGRHRPRHLAVQLRHRHHLGRAVAS